MKFHMLMLMNAWMMPVLMECKCQMQCLTLGCYKRLRSSGLGEDLNTIKRLGVPFEELGKFFFQKS